MTHSTHNTNDDAGIAFLEDANLILKDFPKAFLDVAKKKADERDLKGVRRFIFMANSQERAGRIQGDFTLAVASQSLKISHDKTPMQILEQLAYPTPSVRNEL